MMEDEIKKLKEDQQKEDEELGAREKELDKQIEEAENSNKTWKTVGLGILKAAVYTGIGFGLGSFFGAAAGLVSSVTSSWQSRGEANEKIRKLKEEREKIRS